MSIRHLPFLDVFEDASGGNIKTPSSEFLKNGKIPVIDQGQSFIAGYVNDPVKICKSKPPVIVFGDHTKAIKYVDFYFAMGADGTKVLEPKNGNHTKYLFYALRALHIPDAGYSRHYKFLKETIIPLPPLPEQKRIAAILDAADALRAKRREALAQLDALLQSSFLTLFGDPVTNPMGFARAPLGDVVKLKSGNSLVAKDMTEGGEFPVYGGNGINGYHDSYMFEEPMIVIGRVGAYCGAVYLSKSKSWVTDNALYVDRFLKPIETSYLVTALVAADLNQYAGRAAQPLISGSRVYPVEITMPPLPLQQKFAAIVESIERQKTTQRAHLAELDALFAALQHRAFRGEL